MGNYFKQFGGRITKELIEEYSQSTHWKDGCFQNLEETVMDMGFSKLPSVIYKQFSNRKGREPKAKLPILPFDTEAFLTPSDKMKFIWYGHSVVLMRMLGKTLLIDPMLGPNTTPIAPFATKRFSENTLSLIDEFPEIDLMLLTHDHYDHLDYNSIQKLKGKTKKYFVALGVKRHLLRWGVDENRITEFDWWNKQDFEEIGITYTPTRHFSGRGLKDRSKSLWGGWIFDTKAEKIWFSGDGGYGKHFKEIGEREGPFNFAFMECGQYNEDWRPIHLFPDEAVQAAIDAKAQKIMPVHWAGFALSYQHTWQEPAEEFVAAAKANNVNYATPSLGELVQVSDEHQESWWTNL